MPGRRLPKLLLLALAAILGWPRCATAEFASSVISYTSGALQNPALNSSLAALGSPAPDTGFGMLTPFNPAFDPSHIVEIGPGGSLVLELGAPAPTGAGNTIGVHAAVGLIDVDWPNGDAGTVATLLTNPRVATVAVSADDVAWHSLGILAFDLPTNYFSEGVTTPGYQETPGTLMADFRKPFTATIADFDGRVWTSTLALLNGSAGGSWLDLTGVPLVNVNFIRFEVGPGQRMILDAVAVVPEPLTAGFVMLAALLANLRRQ